MEEKTPEVKIFTDGGCRPNPGPGGWGAVLLYPGQEPKDICGGEDDTTNNRMELQGAIKALEALTTPHRVDLFTDSTYLRQGVTEWLPSWQQRKWRTVGNTSVKNQDLWRAIDEQLKRHQVSWHWVKGHAGNRWNERADRLASSAIPKSALPLDDSNAVHLFTAAAYSGKASAGGWAIILRYREHEKSLSGRTSGATANRMHLEATVRGLQALKSALPVHIYTVSDYLKDGATSWITGWKARNWRTRDGTPVSHRDLWESLDGLARRLRVCWHVISREEAPEEMIRAKEIATAALQSGGQTSVTGTLDESPSGLPPRPEKG